MPGLEDEIEHRADFTTEQRQTATAYARLFSAARNHHEQGEPASPTGRLERLRAKISEQERAVIELVACRDYRFAEVSRLTGNSVEELKRTFRAGLEKLRAEP